MAINYNGHLPSLQEAFRNGRMTFYLGAGISKDNGIPTWEAFVQALYFTTLRGEDYINELRPYPNYLFALAEWVFNQKKEPLEIITRKIKMWYGARDFVQMMGDTLYAAFGRSNQQMSPMPATLLNQNATLRGIVACCQKSVPGLRGLTSIISYNYDNLVELALESYPGKDNFQVVYKQSHRLQPGKIPIYHVHGYIPYEQSSVRYEDILFSEDQYNRAFQDPDFWGNVVQVNRLTSSTGLMIGLSISDRNTRRILDSIANQPVPKDNYILLRKPWFKPLADSGSDIEEIKEKARKYVERFQGQVKSEDRETKQIKEILRKIYEYEATEFNKGFEGLGLMQITFDEFDEIPAILNEIAQ